MPKKAKVSNIIYIESIEEALKRGVEIEQLPYQIQAEESENKINIKNLNPKIPVLKTLAEGKDLYAERKKRKKKVKVAKSKDLEKINKDVLTGSARELFEQIAKEAALEESATDKESHEANSN